MQFNVVSRRQACKFIGSAVPIMVLGSWGAGTAVAGAPAFEALAPDTVDSTLSGQRLLVALDPLSSGGYAVAWVAREPRELAWRLLVQRFSGAGVATGPPLELAYANSVLDPPEVAVIVQDQVTVVAYTVWRIVDPREGWALNGIDTQLFAPDGTPLGSPQTVVSETVNAYSGHYRRLAYPVLAGWTEGGWVVGWSEIYRAPPIFFATRFDASGQPVDGRFSAVSIFGGLFRIETFSDGGWVASAMQSTSEWGSAPVYATFRQFGMRHPLLLPPAGTLAAPSFVLDLGSRGSVLFSGQPGTTIGEVVGPYSQWFNPAGRSAGPAVSLAAIPTQAVALAHGSYVALWPGASANSQIAQCFDAHGRAEGEPFVIDAPADAVLAPLGTGFIVAWAVAPPEGGARVVTQRFVAAVQRGR